MRRILATAALGVGVALGWPAPAQALNPQPEPPGATVVALVARTRFPVLPPNPCVRIPSLDFADNPVLPPNPCFADGRTRGS